MKRKLFEFVLRPRALVAVTASVFLLGSAVIGLEQLFAQDDAGEIVENLAVGDAMRGKIVYRKCKACHTVDKGGPSRIGPNLHGVVGRRAGAVEEFKYSDALTERAESGLVWDAENLDGYLHNPRKFLKGGTMMFSGLRKEQDRLDVIAYMREEGGKE